MSAPGMGSPPALATPIPENESCPFELRTNPSRLTQNEADSTLFSVKLKSLSALATMR